MKEQPNEMAAETAASALRYFNYISISTGFEFIMMKQKIDIFDVVHRNHALDAQW